MFVKLRKKSALRKMSADPLYHLAKVMDAAQLGHFKSVLHEQQVYLINEVLAASLLNLQKELSAIILGQDEFQRAVTLFDQKLEHITQKLNQLNQYFQKEGSWQTRTQRNRLLTAFVFYRVLFDDVLEHVFKGIEVPDPYLLMRRIPAKLFTLSGSEYWRFYELFTLIYGDLKTLTLNADIQSILQSLFQDSNSEKASESQHAASLTTSNRVDFSEDLEQSNQVLSTEKQESKENPAESFKPWLEAQLQSDNPNFQVNGEGWVFSSQLQFKGSLFMMEEGLVQFSNEYQMEIRALKTALIASRQLDQKMFYLQEGKKKKSLYRILNVAAPEESVFVNIVEN